MMKENDFCIKHIYLSPSIVKLHLRDNTIHRYSMKKIHEYANQKTPSREDLEQFRDTIDGNIWFAQKNRKPTLRELAKEYKRTIKTDLDYPIIVLDGSFMSTGAISPYSRRVLLDGTHRLLKCLLTDRKTVGVVVVTTRELLMNVTEIDG